MDPVAFLAAGDEIALAGFAPVQFALNECFVNLDSRPDRGFRRMW